MRKQKVLFVLTKGNWGGAQRYVYDLATNLPREQYETKVVVGQGNELPEKLANAGITTISLPRLGRDLNVFGDLLILFSLIKIFRRERPNIVHLNSSKIGGLGALAARLARVPKIIFTAHGWPFHEERPLFQKFLIRFFSWLTIVLSHQVIVISQSELKAAPTWFGVKKKLNLIYNGIAPTTFLYRDTARETLIRLEPELEIQRHRLWLGTIGELHPNKGLDLALQILAILRSTSPNFIFLVIGEGEEHSNLTALIKKLELQNNVFLLGAIPDAARYLKAFDLFLLSSRKEGLPYVILEAGQAGLAVAASKVGGMPEIIENSRAGVLINPYHPAKTATKLEKLITNNLEREILGRSLEEIIRRKFTLSEMLEKTLVVYNS